MNDRQNEREREREREKDEMKMSEGDGTDWLAGRWRSVTAGPSFM